MAKKEFIERDSTLLKMWNALYALEDDQEEKNGIDLKRRLDVQAGFEAGQSVVANEPSADVVEIPQGGIGEISDGYHTFNALYEQRLILTAALAKAHKDISWKSKLHEDGEVPFGGGWFIVGFSTPEGEYTYHYELKDWDLFDCVELSRGKKWDGHTDKDVKRLLSIPSAADVVERKRGEWVGYPESFKFEHIYDRDAIVCPFCENSWNIIDNDTESFNFCPNCGADMREAHQ